MTEFLDPDRISGPYPLSEIPDPPIAGTPHARERTAGWRLARQWSGYPELEWTDGLMVERVHALGGRIPALFYEPLTDFDDLKFVLRLGSTLRSRNQPSFPSVSVGFEYFDRAYRVSDGRLTLPRDDEPYRGRHWVTAVDHKDPETLMFANSWGTEWGDHGYGYIDRQYFAKHVDAAIARWSSVAGLSPAMHNHLASYRSGRSERYIDCWSTPNVYWIDYFTHRDRTHDLLLWQVGSFETDRTVYVLELRGPLRIIGRAHLFRLADRAVLKELFVIPSMRRRGYGRILEQAAVACARSADLRAVELWVSAADGRPRTLPTAESFALATGYKWQLVDLHRPNVVAIAGKEVS